MSRDTKDPALAIDTERLRDDIADLARIGRSEDDLGIYRMAFTKADMEARDWLEERARWILAQQLTLVSSFSIRQARSLGSVGPLVHYATGTT